MPNYRFIQQRDLDYIRKVQEDNLLDTCVVQRPTKVSNGKGGWTNTWTDIDTYNCRFWISSGPSGTSQESHFWGEKEVSNTVGFVTLPWDADVQAKDRIVWTNAETGEERTVYVTGLQKSDTWITATRVRVESLRQS